MKLKNKKHFTRLGLHIVLMFFAAFGMLVFAAYFVLSQNFQNLLTNYTIKFVQSMVGQDVTMIEYELKSSQKEAAALAADFAQSIRQGNENPFPPLSAKADILRILYISENGVTASDGSAGDPRGREDILEAYRGNPASYGPYFNENKEYVICYSTPVIYDNKIIGVLSIEKDGYYFSSLIKNIRFADTGESYIINAAGTDIAVSKQEHIEWVNKQYNARQLLQAKEDPVTRSIFELEQKGLSGESGIGSYYWDGGLCYLVYAPVPSVNWVLLAGIRQEEILSMTQSALYAAIAKTPILGVCITLFLLLVALIFFWIVSNLKKSTEMNKKLIGIANYDALTGAKNRNCFHAALAAAPDGCSSFACIYADANGLHEVNNHLGHQAGDAMLKNIVETFRRFLPQSDIFRIGGDEFVVFCKDIDEAEINETAARIQKELTTQGYETSLGLVWRDQNLDASKMVNLAETLMQQDKQEYYKKNGIKRQIRALNQDLERMLLEKQDADTFLSVLAPEFKGVYFVNLGNDTIRHLYIPSYFEEILKETGDVFSKALLLYAHRIVMPEYQQAFAKFCNYGDVETHLKEKNALEFIYQKNGGTWMKMQILKFKTYTKQSRETLWIFSEINHK